MLLLLLSCRSPAPLIDCSSLRWTERAADAPDNFLILLTDDIGIDKTGFYGAHPAPAPTPNIDELACAGLSFTSAYASPTCSPSRAALMTGRHASRSGIGSWLRLRGDHSLPLDEETLPEALGAYAAAAVGKWHLAGRSEDTDPRTHPGDQGFPRYAGSLGNPQDSLTRSGEERGYHSWERTEDGRAGWSRTYMLTDTVDTALAVLEDLPEPWLVYVAFNGAHAPFHAPPRDLITSRRLSLRGDLRRFDAMVEATDHELGRLLTGLDPETLANTTIVYAADNGTPSAAVAEPWERSRSKGTLYEGGINVPLIIAGPHVATPGSRTDHLAHLVDILPTLLDIAGVKRASHAPLDGVSLLPHLRDPDASVREVVYAERFEPNGPPPYSTHNRMVTDGEWKLIRWESDGEHWERLYRMEGWQDGQNRLGASDPEVDAAYARLSAVMAEKIAALQYAHPQ